MHDTPPAGGIRRPIRHAGIASEFDELGAVAHPHAGRNTADGTRRSHRQSVRAPPARFAPSSSTREQCGTDNSPRCREEPVGRQARRPSSRCSGPEVGETRGHRLEGTDAERIVILDTDLHECAMAPLLARSYFGLTGHSDRNRRSDSHRAGMDNQFQSVPMSQKRANHDEFRHPLQVET